MADSESDLAAQNFLKLKSESVFIKCKNLHSWQSLRQGNTATGTMTVYTLSPWPALDLNQFKATKC